MVPKSILFGWLCLAMLLLTNTCLWSQDGIINGKDDYEFAQALARIKWHDCAQYIAEQMERATFLSYQQKQKAKLLRCSLLQIRGDQERDVEKKSKFYQQAIGRYKKIIMSMGGSEKLIAQLDLGDLLLKQSQYWIDKAKNSEVSEKSVFHNKALPLAREARQFFSQVKSKAANRKKATTDPQEIAKYADFLYQGWYGICRALYFQGLCDPNDNFQDCLYQTEEFIWEYEGKIGAFYAMLLRGMALHEKQNYEQAIDCFNGVLQPVYNAKSPEVIRHPKMKVLGLQACYYQARTFNSWRYFDKVIQLGDTFLAFYRKNYSDKLIDTDFGQAIILELGKAQVGQGNYAKAIELVQPVAENKNYWGRMAQNLLQQWGKLNPNALNDAKNAHSVASGLWRQDKYLDAILTYLKVVQHAKGRSQIEQYALDAWEKMGQSYWFLKLYRESAFCYTVCAQKYRKYSKIVKNANGKEQKIKIAPKAAYWAYRAYREVFKISKREQDLQQSNKMREFLLKKWPKSGYSHNLSFDRARDRERQAEASKTAAAYTKAASAYRQVNKQADLYERAQVYTGRCYYKAGESALKASKKYLSLSKQIYAQNFAIPATAKKYYLQAIRELVSYQRYAQQNPVMKLNIPGLQRRKQSLAETYLYMGRIFLRLGKPQKTRRYFRKLYQEYSEQKDMATEAFCFLIQMRLAAGELEQAEQLLQAMKKLYGSIQSPGMAKKYQSYCYFLLGRKYLAIAGKLREQEKNAAKSSPQLILHYRKAVSYLWEWISNKHQPTAENYNNIAGNIIILANLLLENGEEKAAKSWYRRAYTLFKKCLPLFDDSKTQKRIQVQMVECAIRIEDWEKAIYEIYPIYHNDKDMRHKKSEKTSAIEDDPVYLNYLAQALTGLAQKSVFADAKKLLFFLLPRAHRDFIDDLRNFFPEANDRSMFEKYKYGKENLAWISGSFLEDDEKQKLDNEFAKRQRQEQQRQQNRSGSVRDAPKYYYRNLYTKLIDEAFPQEPQNTLYNSLQESDYVLHIQRLSLVLAYEFTSKLVDNMPRYKNVKVRFGIYDNPLWWEAKYRQIFLIYLRGNKKYANSLIKILQLQQKKMGGPRYKRMFAELLQKTTK